MTHIESFDSLADLTATLTQRNAEALARLNPMQKSLSWGSYAITPAGGTLIFGQIPDEQTLREIERATYDQPMDAEEHEELEVMVAQTNANMENGRLYGKWFSTLEPEGEWGSHHKLNCWPIDEATFEWAHEVGWGYTSFPLHLRENIDSKLDELMFHLFAAGRPS